LYKTNIVFYKYTDETKLETYTISPDDPTDDSIYIYAVGDVLPLPIRIMTQSDWEDHVFLSVSDWYSIRKRQEDPPRDLDHNPMRDAFIKEPLRLKLERNPHEYTWQFEYHDKRLMMASFENAKKSLEEFDEEMYLLWESGVYEPAIDRPTRSHLVNLDPPERQTGLYFVPEHQPTRADIRTEMSRDLNEELEDEYNSKPFK
jgi:hypothetical protein